MMTKIQMKKFREDHKIDDSTVFCVNAEGWASLYSGEDAIFVSKEQDYDFEFREYSTANDLDGISFTGLTDDDIQLILLSFEFERDQL